MNVLKLAIAKEFLEWHAGDMIPRFSSSGEYVETVLWAPGVLTVSPQNWEFWQSGMKRFCFFNPVTSCFFFRGPWSFTFRAFTGIELGKIFDTIDALFIVESLPVEDINEVISSYFENLSLPQTQSPLWATLSPDKLENLLQNLQKANKSKSIKVNWVLSSEGVTRHEV